MFRGTYRLFTCRKGYFQSHMIYRKLFYFGIGNRTVGSLSIGSERFYVETSCLRATEEQSLTALNNRVWRRRSRAAFTPKSFVILFSLLMLHKVGNLCGELWENKFLRRATSVTSVYEINYLMSVLFSAAWLSRLFMNPDITSRAVISLI